MVQLRVTLRIVTDEHFTESRLEGLDVLGKLFAIVKIKLFLPTFLGWTRGQVTIRLCIAQDGGTELFVYQNARLFPGHATGQRGLESVVDHLLCGTDPGSLLFRQCPFPSEHLGLEGTAMIKGLNIE